MFLMLKLAGSEVRFVTLKATLPDKYSLFAGLATVRLSCAKANVEKSAVKNRMNRSNGLKSIHLLKRKLKKAALIYKCYGLNPLNAGVPERSNGAERKCPTSRV